MLHWEQSLHSYHANNAGAPHALGVSLEGSSPVFYMFLGFREEISPPLNAVQEDYNLPCSFLYRFKLNVVDANKVHIDYSLNKVNERVGLDIGKLAALVESSEVEYISDTLDVSMQLLNCADGTCALMDNDCIANIFAHACLFGVNTAAQGFKPHYHSSQTQDLKVWDRTEHDLLAVTDRIMRITDTHLETHSHICGVNDSHTIRSSYRMVRPVSGAIEGWGRQASASASGFGYPLSSYLRYLNS